MKAKLIAAILVMVVSIATSATAQDAFEPTGLRPDAPAFAIHGPYHVGTMEIQVEYAERSVPVSVWYPALNSDKIDELTTYSAGLMEVAPDLDTLEGHAIRDAEPATLNGPYPLVVVSHGLGAFRYGQLYLTEHLASQGFVVMAPQHVGTAIADFFTASEEDFAANHIASQFYRPADMKHTIEYADQLTENNGALEGLINTDLVAVVGYSTGGTTAFQAAGARLDFEALASWCEGHGEEWYAHEACQFLGQEEILAKLYDFEPDASDLWPALSDNRVDALIAFAPGGELPTFGTRGIAEITVPTLLVTGTADSVVAPEYNTYWAYEQVGATEKALVTFENGGHMVFGYCPEAWVAAFYEFCSDPVWDVSRARDISNHITTAFLKDVLYGDEEAHTALMPEAVNFPGITYETTIQ